MLEPLFLARVVDGGASSASQLYRADGWDYRMDIPPSRSNSTLSSDYNSCLDTSSNKYKLSSI
jgi:hypothetical protein